MTQRWEYDSPGLDEGDLAGTPWRTLTAWVDGARARQESVGDLYEPLAMAVATVDSGGLPDVRTLLMRVFTPRGPGFVTSTDSAKGAQLASHPVAAATLTWPVIHRAIRFRGPVRQVPAEEIEAYWFSRPRGSQLAAYASHQSAPIGSRDELAAAFDEAARRFDEGAQVPMPSNWGAYQIIPDEIELWAGRPSRLHDRIRYTRISPGSMDEAQAWRIERLQP